LKNNARTNEIKRDLVMTDTERLEFIANWAKRSRTGVSIEWTRDDGFRFMTFHKVDQGKPSLREAIDAAMALRRKAELTKG
jgi:hypothetical protein